MTTILHAAITGIATTGVTADTGTATTGMTADTGTTVETDHADDGTGVDREKALSFQAGSALYPELAFPAGASRVRQSKETRSQETSQATGNGPPETDQRLTVRRIA